MNKDVQLTTGDFFNLTSTEHGSMIGSVTGKNFYPIIGWDSLPGTSYNFDKETFFPLIFSGEAYVELERTTQTLDEIQKLFRYIEEYEPGSVTNEHLIFCGSVGAKETMLSGKQTK